MSRTASTPHELRTRLDDLTYTDAHRLRRRLRRARGDALDRLKSDLAAAEHRVAQRQAAVPTTIDYPAQLPVTACREEIAEAISQHQVVIVAGETGSGKTTQIPKICLGLGYGVRGMIGHTQPRRLAARSVAERIAEELHTEIGATVGYTVRFTDHAAENTLIKVMTDGILLAEIQRDPLLRAYDTLIIDEAHERSLNIDFLLGYLKQLLPRRPELRVIITSATIDPELFARHFTDSAGQQAPIIEVSGRSYPVEVRYRPLSLPATSEEPDIESGEPERVVDRDPVDAICAAVSELFAEGDGDVLVFLSGEREIRDTADALRNRKLARTEILPLYARLSSAEQHRVFTPHTGRRVVLATNVAETSLTVPGIRYVVDPGTARISRYSLRTKVQRLPIEPISQASARQRAGRCGRVADGICIRLYSEADFEARPAFTDPEILRTNLAAVILRMTALGLGDIAGFPFVEPPDARAIRDGIALLTELGALAPTDTRQAQLTLTTVGKDMSRLPVDPRMARMLTEAQQQGCLTDVLIIVAALSIQDVRERPAEHQQAADTQHARFSVPGSDFLAYLRLWDYVAQQRSTLSANQFRRRCREEFLHYLRIREWQDLQGQLRTITKELGWSAGKRDTGTDTALPPAQAAAIHQALLAGMLSHIGVREAESREFLGARAAKFMVFPGSVLAKKPPRWVMAAELVETSRLWGRTAASIEPEWAEKLAGDLVKRQYSEPHWSTKRGGARAYERVTLYGVPLVTRRPVDYGRIDPVAARELFLRHALVEGQWHTRHEFFARNQELRTDAADLEHRARRRDIVVDDEVLFEFYDQRVPADVVSVRHFDRWWREAKRRDPTALDFAPDTLINPEASGLDPTDFPDAWRQGELSFALTYQFEPGTADDGVTVRIPIPQLPQVRAVGFDWLVPGMRAELATAFIKTLPKPLRRAAVPAPDFATAALAALTARAEPIRVGLARELSRLTGVTIHPNDLNPAALPAHLRMTFAGIDERGQIVTRSKSLPQLRTELGSTIAESVTRETADSERDPVTVWTSASLGTVPETVTRTVAGSTITGYPALVSESEGVAVRVFSSAAQQRVAMRTGTRDLVLRAIPTSSRAALRGFSAADRLVLSQNPYGSLDALVDDCRAAAADELIAAAGGPVRDPAQFQALLTKIRSRFADAVADRVRLTVPILTQAHRVRTALPQVGERDIAADVREQFNDLVFPGFISEFPRARLRELPRYLQAAHLRLTALPAAAQRDRQGMAEIDAAVRAYNTLLARLAEPRRDSPDVQAIWWMIEELRVSLFAQRLGTPHPVSVRRIERAIAAIST